MEVKAYLEITMQIDNTNRPAAAKVYTDYRAPWTPLKVRSPRNCLFVMRMCRFSTALIPPNMLRPI